LTSALLVATRKASDLEVQLKNVRQENTEMKKEAERLRAKYEAKIKSMEETMKKIRTAKAAAAEQHQNEMIEMKKQFQEKKS
jgi:regulator of replication initiation timing